MADSNQIFITHSGTDTWFSIQDGAYLIGQHELDDYTGDASIFDDSEVTDAAMQHGYHINEELATQIYELVMNYYEAGNC